MITPKQRQLLKYLIDQTARNGYQPSTKEMAVHFGCQVAAVVQKLDRLQDLGFITLSAVGKGRCITINHLQFVPKVVS